MDICTSPQRRSLGNNLSDVWKRAKNWRKTSVQKYIPKGVIEKTNMADITSLDEALSRGDYSELGKTAEEAGQKCLKSGSESLKSCDEIAQKFFRSGRRERIGGYQNANQTGGRFLSERLGEYGACNS